MTQNTSTPENELANRRAYTIAQAAELLGVHKVSVYRRIYSGQIKVLSGFGRLTIPANELDRFLNKVEVYTPRKRRGFASKKVQTEAAASPSQTSIPAEVANKVCQARSRFGIQTEKTCVFTCESFNAGKS
jgi:excisionase family DNA binding protein